MELPKRPLTRRYVIFQPNLVRNVADFQIRDRVPDLRLFHQNMLVTTQCTPEAQ